MIGSGRSREEKVFLIQLLQYKGYHIKKDQRGSKGSLGKFDMHSLELMGYGGLFDSILRNLNSNY